MKKIVIASNAFKGSLTSGEVASSVEQAIMECYPECDVVKITVADGGSGTVDALLSAFGGQRVWVDVHDPLMRPVRASYGVTDDSSTAIIEMAAASGLELVQPELRNPMLTTTYGTGELIVDALRRGCRRFIIGLGDSATNDAGIGMLQALGVRFYDAADSLVGCGGGVLSHVARIDVSGLNPALANSSFTVASDVQSPLCGMDGAAYVFAPQKGATPEMVVELDKALCSFASVVVRHNGVDLSQHAGAGAAGGLGFALMSFMRAEIVSGIGLVLGAVGFDDKIEGADMIITGEGRIDNQTIKGKSPSIILAAAKSRNIPVVALCGSLEPSPAMDEHGFTAIFPILPALIPLEQAMNRDYTMANIRRTVTQFLRVMAALK